MQPMNDQVEFMKDLERRFQFKTQFADRSLYKIFYCPIRHARILALGINPGGNPAKTSADTGYYENNSHDILDCQWRENFGLRRLLRALLEGNEERIRTEVVKTNLVFRRSARRTDINLAADAAVTKPFLEEIIERVSPRLVLLAGVNLDDFAGLYASKVTLISPPERDIRTRQVVFAAARGKLNCLEHETVLVQVAHASQFAWTYEKYAVAEKILNILNAIPS